MSLMFILEVTQKGGRKEGRKGGREGGRGSHNARTISIQWINRGGYEEHENNYLFPSQPKKDSKTAGRQSKQENEDDEEMRFNLSRPCILSAALENNKNLHRRIMALLFFF